MTWVTRPGQPLQLKSEPKWYPRGGAGRLGDSLNIFSKSNGGLLLVVVVLRVGGCTLVRRVRQ